MTATDDQRWDLDSIFPGGSASSDLEHFLAALEPDIEAATVHLQAHRYTLDMDAWLQVIDGVQNLAERHRQAGAFVGCLEAADTADRAAKALRGRISQQGASLRSMFTLFDDGLAALPDATFAALGQHPRLRSSRFHLEERRRRAKERLAPAEEQLVAALMVDGYHGWSQLYNTVVGRMSVHLQAPDGQTTPLSMGQAQNRMSSPDKAVRDQVFRSWEAAWAGEAEVLGDALNHLAGFRLTVYRRRGWSEVLAEPLDVNRMEPATLRTMWSVIDANKPAFVDYLRTKARLLGLPGLGWQDVEAPLGAAGRSIPYAEARTFIVGQFRAFSPDMADFADACFEKRWIEAEDRPGKRPGGFCTSFPLSEQTRIFTTYGGTIGGVAVLAHELGHAYHQHVMRGLPRFARGYAMNVAETASTFAEMLIADASLRAAATAEERTALLDDKLRRSVTMFMNIHARFLFEREFYAARAHGPVPVDRLNRLMEEAQRTAYRDALASYHPHFWASKLHFYITGTPFYNFPYTFGYLFSAGIYARARQAGPGFAADYVALLRDTATMRVEDLAAKHLGVDLREPDFWQSAIDTLLPDVKEFIASAR